VHQQLLLVLAVLAVGVFHTLVPDHWLPITMLARQAKWGRSRTAGAAAIAGLGHTVSTLAIGLLVWLAGAAVALRFGHIVALAASAALVVFGAWFALAALRELRNERAGLKSGIPPVHPHSGHEEEIAAEMTGGLSASQRARVTLLLILGSSPMVEGLPAFLAASRFGPGLLAIMSVVFALSTIVTYVFMCDQSTRMLQRFSFGPLERYGEVISGCVILIVGVASFFWL
jgi:hypothetical protein